MYAPVPLALIQDSAIDASAVRVGAAILSNNDGWEVSTTSLGDTCNMSRQRAGQAIVELVNARWVAREALGRNRYVLHMARVQPFSEDEHASLNTFAKPTGGRRPNAARRELEQGSSLAAGDGCQDSEQGACHDSGQPACRESEQELDEYLNQNPNKPLLSTGPGTILESMGLGGALGGISLSSFLLMNPHAEDNVIPARAHKVGATVDEIIGALRTEFGDDRRMPNVWWESIAVCDPVKDSVPV